MSRRGFKSLLVVAAVLVLPAAAHEPRRTTARRDATEIFPGGDRVRLGTGEAELRERFGDALVAGRKSLAARAVPEALWLHREIATAELAYAEYELFAGRVIRVRWRLARRFERPLFPHLAHQARHHLGEPDVEEEITGELADATATRRRLVWTREAHALELRQLHPLTGGPVFLTLTDRDAVRAMSAAGRIVSPPPERTAAWWTSKPSLPRIPSAEERWKLVWAFEDVLLAVLASAT